MKARRAYVIGSGPNGLTAAIVLARAGYQTTVFEANAVPGGAVRSAELTLPGFIHDVFSAVYPMAAVSPAFATSPLAEFGLEWIHAPLPLAHPFDDGTAATISRSLEQTCADMGDAGRLYRRIAGPWVARWPELAAEILAPLHFPESPLLLSHFGSFAVLPAAVSARIFPDFRTQTLFAGLAAHAALPFSKLASSAAGWVLAAAAHVGGWPIPKGGAQSITRALLGYFASLGGEIVLNHRVSSLDELAGGDAILCDVAPRQFLQLAGSHIPDSFRRKLSRFRHGPGVFKMDWALSAPVPWKSPICARAGTVHLGGSLKEIAESEAAVWAGNVSARPFVLLAQPSLFDPSRAPTGQHTVWAYCHVPSGSTVDCTSQVESQVERFAPGFRSLIRGRHSMRPADCERENENLAGGDPGGGAMNLKQLLFRPTASFYRTPLPRTYLCSASTPPGGGAHGMCGWHAADCAIRYRNNTV